MSLLLALRDILQRRAIVVAIGVEADITGRQSPLTRSQMTQPATLAAKFDVLQSALFPITVW
jgi:poly-gamma-glutamate capsule biosynthesis protein CapA/YwtB (metallophosphatase superfamily)